MDPGPDALLYRRHWQDKRHMKTRKRAASQCLCTPPDGRRARESGDNPSGDRRFRSATSRADANERCPPIVCAGARPRYFLAAQGLAAQGFAPHSVAAHGFAEHSLAAHGPAAQGAAAQLSVAVPSSARSTGVAAGCSSTGLLSEQADVAIARPPATANIDANFALFIILLPTLWAERSAAAAPCNRIRNVRPDGRPNSPVSPRNACEGNIRQYRRDRFRFVRAKPRSPQVRSLTTPGYSSRRPTRSCFRRIRASSMDREAASPRKRVER